MLGCLRKKLHGLLIQKKEHKELRKQTKMERELKRVVASCGDKLEVFGEPELSFPENLRIGQRCKINSLVYLNARSGITLGDDVTLSRGEKLISTGYDLDLFF